MDIFMCRSMAVTVVPSMSARHLEDMKPHIIIAVTTETKRSGGLLKVVRRWEVGRRCTHCTMLLRRTTVGGGGVESRKCRVSIGAGRVRVSTRGRHMLSGVT